MAKTKLSDTQIAQALENSVEEEEEFVLPDFSSDSESEYVFSASEIEDEFSDDGAENIEDATENMAIYKGKDGTIWSKVPHQPRKFDLPTK